MRTVGHNFAPIKVVLLLWSFVPLSLWVCCLGHHQAEGNATKCVLTESVLSWWTTVCHGKRWEEKARPTLVHASIINLKSHSTHLSRGCCTSVPLDKCPTKPSTVDSKSTRRCRKGRRWGIPIWCTLQKTQQKSTRVSDIRKGLLWHYAHTLQFCKAHEQLESTL